MCEIVEQFIEEGKNIGRAEGELNAMFKLVSQDLLPAQIAAEQIGLTVEEFNAKLNDYLSKAKKD